ncbi:MAG: holo-ACP synthase [Coriobacteriia bacterium]|nr:holo-ACP synthase [Coriobacteriia bacterium]
MQEQSDLIVGVGVEIVDIERFSQVLDKYPRVRDRLFSADECAYCESKTLAVTHYALYFVAKQAVLKVLGNGFSGVRFSNVEISRDEKGKPIPELAGNAPERAAELGIIELHLSLTFTHDTAVASAVAITQAARPAADQDLTFEEKMTKAFNELRSLLDSVGTPIDESVKSAPVETENVILDEGVVEGDLDE